MSENKEAKKRVPGSTILFALLGLGIILIGLVLMAATNGQAPRVHAPAVLPAKS